MFKFTNPHPQGKRVGDCVKRACCLASEINYHDIAIMLNRFKAISGAKSFNAKDNDRPFVEKVLLGKNQGNMQYANNGHRYIVSDYANVCGKSIVMVAKHLVCCNGKGDYLDTWDCGWKSIYRAFAIPPYEIIVNHIRKNYPKLCKGLSLERI
jgi:hypothetical protein